MKYLFYIAKAYSIPIIEPLAITLDKRETPYALFVSEKVKKALPPHLRKVPVFTELPEAIAFGSDFVLAPGNFIDFRLPGIKVQIFHGLGVEKESHFKIRHFFDVYCTSGPMVTRRFEQMQKKYRCFLVRETGWPKVDYIINYRQQDLRGKFGIPLDKRVILYAPTFSRRMQSASDLLPSLPKIIRDDEMWLIKFHELMKKEVLDAFDGNSIRNIKIVDTHDITPLLHIADCMVSDTSSVLYEFLVLDKPVVTYRTMSRPEKGINITHPDQLRAAVDAALQNGVSPENQRCLMEVHPYNDGQVCQGLIDQLEEIKTRDLLPKKHKKWNLFRKAQILYHERFRKGYLR